jgi:sugar phosphate isomerase/epimerase
LYSIRTDCAKDLPGCLEKVAKMGYEGVEFAGFYNKTGQELRKLLDDNGLKVAGTHIGLDTLLGDQFQKSVELHQALGNKFLIVPGLAEKRRNSKEAWLETAKIFNEIAEKLKPLGMFTGYHNHTIEFTPMDGEAPWDIFFGNTKPEVVMQVDTGHVLRAGEDPIVVADKYPGHAKTVHLKEFSKTNPNALIGEGDMKWNDWFTWCETKGGTEWYIVEQESYAYEPMKCVELCVQKLREMGK